MIGYKIDINTCTTEIGSQCHLATPFDTTEAITLKLLFTKSFTSLAEYISFDHASSISPFQLFPMEPTVPIYPEALLLCIAHWRQNVQDRLVSCSPVSHRCQR